MFWGRSSGRKGKCRHTFEIWFEDLDHGCGHGRVLTEQEDFGWGRHFCCELLLAKLLGGGLV